MKSILIILICTMFSSSVLADDTTPTTEPAHAASRPAISRDARVKQLLDYLEALYAKKTDSPD